MMKRSTIRLEWDGKQEVESSPIGSLAPAIEVYPRGITGGCPTTGPNKLFLDNNLVVLDHLLSTDIGSLQLIYADPPFATGKEFQRRIGRGEDSRKPETWRMGAGYIDSWDSMEAYLSMLKIRLVKMRELLCEDGTLFLHLDWRAVHYAKVLLDEVFGPENFLNEIIWVYHGPSPVRAYFNRKHDTILVYAKGRQPKYFPDRVRVPYHPSTRKTFASSKKAGFGKKPDLDRGKIPEDWWYFPVTARLHKERTGYPTQKPRALLDRIILTASDEGDCVADFFCGSGTTLQAAEDFRRRWIGCDFLPQSIAVCQRRLALCKAQPYTMITRTGELSFVQGKSKLTLAISKNKKTVELAITHMAPCSPTGFPDALEYWEVDFHYTGQPFRSMGQSARPWRSGDLALQMTHTYEQPGEYTIACRAISGDAEIAWNTASINIT